MHTFPQLNDSNCENQWIDPCTKYIYILLLYKCWSYITTKKMSFFFLGSKHSKHVIRTFEKSCFNYQELKMALKSHQWKHGWKRCFDRLPNPRRDKKCWITSHILHICWSWHYISTLIWECSTSGYDLWMKGFSWEVKN